MGLSATGSHTYIRCTVWQWSTGCPRWQIASRWRALQSVARLRDIIYHLSPLVLCNLIAQIYSACTCIYVCPTRIHKSLCTPPRARRNAVASSHAAQEQQPTALLRSATPIQSRHFKGPVLLPAASPSWVLNARVYRCSQPLYLSYNYIYICIKTHLHFDAYIFVYIYKYKCIYLLIYISGHGFVCHRFTHVHTLYRVAMKHRMT
jgi:hypothetical protein